jgi:RNA polymerase sigma factor (TIGR02999 family)
MVPAPIDHAAEKYFRDSRLIEIFAKTGGGFVSVFLEENIYGVEGKAGRSKLSNGTVDAARDAGYLSAAELRCYASPMQENTQNSSDTRVLLARWKGGDPQAGDELASLMYSNLRRLASSYMRNERPGHTLSPTGLVHEAYMRLAGEELAIEDRGHLLAIAAREMRRVLVDHARTRGREKRGGNAWQQITLDDAHRITGGNSVDVLAVEEALDRLKQIDERKAQLLDLICFGGLTVEESAAALHLSTATVGRDLKMARAWLQRELRLSIN